MRTAMLSMVALGLLAGCGGVPVAPGCLTRSTSLDGVCAPAAGLRANTPLVIEVREGCGSVCGQSPAFTCDVQVNGSVIAVNATVTECSRSDQVCPAVCRVATVSCTVPSLAPGSYSVVNDSTVLTQALVISAAATATSCQL
jgi:hypothetical protein